jgi:hypothetical protein
MKAQASYTPAGTGAGQWDFTNTWIIYEGNTNPLLRSFLTPLTVTATSGTKTYDGVAGNGVTYSTTPNGNLLGTVNYGTSANAGTATTSLSGLYSNQQGYLISYVNGSVTINPAPITIVGLGVGADNKSKTYGSPDPALTYTLTSGSLSNGGSFSGSLARDPGENAGSYTIRQGTLTAGSNYTITFNNGTLTINRANATVTGNSSTGSYTGQPQSVTGFTVSGLVNNESASVLTSPSASGASATNAGSYTNTVTGNAIDGNYNLSFVNGVLTVIQVTRPPAPTQTLLPLTSTSTTTSGITVSLSGSTASTVAVMVPSTLLSGFSVALPAQLLSGNAGGTVTALTASGAALPPWLSFDPVTLALTATVVPTGGLPLSIVFMIDGKPVTVELKAQ